MHANSEFVLKARTARKRTRKRPLPPLFLPTTQARHLDAAHILRAETGPINAPAGVGNGWMDPCPPALVTVPSANPSQNPAKENVR